MESNVDQTKEMGVFQQVIGIFTAPRETFESLDQKPTWIIPFVIGIIFFLIMQYFTLDIQVKDQIALLKTKDMSAERFEMAKSQMEGPMKYIILIAGPIVIPIVWAVFAGLFLMMGNLMIGNVAGVTFKKTFSIVAWTSLIGSLSMILMTFLIMSKGTSHGIAMDLSVVLPSLKLGEEQTVIYRLLSKFDLFVIWQIVLWSIGMSVAYKTTTQKAAMPIVVLWGIWIVISVALGGVFQNLGM